MEIAFKTSVMELSVSLLIETVFSEQQCDNDESGL